MDETRHFERSLDHPVDDAETARTESPLRLVVQTVLRLAQEPSLEATVQVALDAGLQLSGARYGVFLYRQPGDLYSQPGVRDEPFRFNKVSGLGEHSLPPSSLIHGTPLLAELLSGPDAVRWADIRDTIRDTGYTQDLPFQVMPAGLPPARSYLALPVRGRRGVVLGAMLYGHPGVDVFQAEAESLVAAVGAQAAMALDNARLAASLKQEIGASEAARQLQRLTAERLRQALEAAGLGTWSWDRATDLLDLDERCAALFHVKAGLPVSRSELREHLVLPEDRELTREQLRQALSTDGAYRAEYRVDDSGVLTWISTHGLATRSGDESSPITGMVGVAQDITARKAQEEALRISEKLAATGRLAATIAHEINNPLEAVTNLIYLAKTDTALPTHLEQLLETADTELARVAQIAQQTLGFYRDTTRPTEIDLNGLLAAVTALFARKLLYKRLQCTLDIEPGLRLFGLAGEMRQIFSNLLVNAIDASHTGTIHLRARHRKLGGKPGVVVLLSDPGSGIPHHVRSRLFSPFFTTKQSVGTGLGLWVTRGMVEKHGGRIHFRSRIEEPTGTVFRVHLPKGSAAGAVYSSATTNLVQ